ncbi:hypothetical protein Taro_055361, partial [Colocasia esculenta]|nr:hypothetical protein [Colocasia esculenta]
GADVDSRLTSRGFDVGFVLAARVLPSAGATRGLFSLILSSLFPSSFTYVLLQHFGLLTGARGKVVMRVAVADRAGNDGSDGGSCGKLLGIVVCGADLPVWESAGGWFSCWRLKKSTSRDVDVDLFREEVGYKRHDPCRRVWVNGQSATVYLLLAAVDAAVYCLLGDM